MSRLVYLSLVVIIAALVAPEITLADTLGTTLFVPNENIPPILVEYIPNYTLARNTNATNVFKLEDYFEDNETLTFSVTAGENVTVEITEEIDPSDNLTKHYVSYYPVFNFTGISTVVFEASDGYFNTSSNVVYINVTADTTPPQWSGAARSKSTIRAGDLVTFSMSWTDNIGLSSYSFSINEGSGWVNYSRVEFTASANTSAHLVTIGAGGGTVVQWRFDAMDTSGNLNASDVQNFTVTSSPQSSSSSSSGGGGSEPGALGTDNQKKEVIINNNSNYTLSSAFFFVELKQGSSATIVLRVTNTGNVPINFTVFLEGLEDFSPIISNPLFSLGVGDSQTIFFDFSTGEYFQPDIYQGKIILSTTNRKEVPITIIVNPIKSEFTLSVKLADKTLFPGSKIIGEITLENLEDIKKKNITLYTAIINLYGGLIDSQQETLEFAVKTLVLERNFTLPEPMAQGQYVFYSRAVEGRTIVLDGDLFEVGARFGVFLFVRPSLLLLIILLVVIITGTFMVRHYQARERLRLLNLYLMAVELKGLLKDNKIDQALLLYTKIKRLYDGSYSRAILKDKEKLKAEMEKLANSITTESKPIALEAAKEEKVKEPKKETSQSDEKASIPEQKENTEEKKDEEKK